MAKQISIYITQKKKRTNGNEDGQKTMVWMKKWAMWKKKRNASAENDEICACIRVYVDEALWYLFFSVMGINNLVGVKITRDDVMAAFIRTEMNWNAEREREKNRIPKKPGHTIQSYCLFWISFYQLLFTPCNFTFWSFETHPQHELGSNANCMGKKSSQMRWIYPHSTPSKFMATLSGLFFGCGNFIECQENKNIQIQNRNHPSKKMRKSTIFCSTVHKNTEIEKKTWFFVSAENWMFVCGWIKSTKDGDIHKYIIYLFRYTLMLIKHI